MRLSVSRILRREGNRHKKKEERTEYSRGKPEKICRNQVKNVSNNTFSFASEK